MKGYDNETTTMASDDPCCGSAVRLADGYGFRKVTHQRGSNPFAPQRDRLLDRARSGRARLSPLSAWPGEGSGPMATPCARSVDTASQGGGRFAPGRKTGRRTGTAGCGTRHRAGAAGHPLRTHNHHRLDHKLQWLKHFGATDSSRFVVSWASRRVLREHADERTTPRCLWVLIPNPQVPPGSCIRPSEPRSPGRSQECPNEQDAQCGNVCGRPFCFAGRDISLRPSLGKMLHGCCGKRFHRK